MDLTELRARLKLRRADKAYGNASLDRFINRAKDEICSKHPWSWLRRSHLWTTHAAVTFSGAGFVLTEREFSGAAGQVASSIGRRCKIDSTLYKIADNRSGTRWVLDRPFASASGDYSVVMFHDEFSLPAGAQTVLSVEVIQNGGNVEILDFVHALDMQRLDPDETGSTPRRYSVVRRPPIVAPRLAPPAVTSSGSGTGPGGTHVYKYAWSHIDRQTGAESALSATTSVTVNNDFIWTATVTPGTHVRHGYDVRIYRTLAGGSDLYWHSDLRMNSGSSSTFSDDQQDIQLSRRTPPSSTPINVRLHPIPSARTGLRATYQFQHPDLANAADEPLWDPQFHHVLLDGAEAAMLEAEDEQGRAQVASRRFQLGLASMLRSDRPVRAPLTVGPSSIHRGRSSSIPTAAAWEYP
jgi:hypothetical protein|tara:strand:- start:1013 stop:2242 length:1230 start_codon:yes stop_codon:yes gene_type:complete